MGKKLAKGRHALLRPGVRRKIRVLRKAIIQILFGAGTNLAASGSVLAQDDTVDEVVTIGVKRDEYRLRDSSLDKFTEALRDTPQSITSLTKELMDDRGVMSLNDALRNIPGITLGAGEFTWQGNNPTIRGFSSRNDMFLDGIRDFGSYNRDPFNLEAVEVFQGPSSTIFGRGSTGGVVNQVSKMPLPDPLRNVNVNVGNADTLRVTADINQPLPNLGKNASVRLNLMRQVSDVPQRDGTETDNWGFAPVVTMALGKAGKLTVGFLKLKAESVPDYGLPWVAGKPAPVDQKTFYGFDSDFLNTDADITTLRIDHKLGDGLAAKVLLRYAKYSRESRITEPQVSASVTEATPLSDVVVHRRVFQGQSTESMLTGQFNLVAEFDTGVIKHALVTGIEVANESSSPMLGFAVDVPSTTLLDPVRQEFSSTGTRTRADADSDVDSLAAYVIDTMKFGDSWQLVAGLRWDHIETNFTGVRFDPDGATDGVENLVSKDIELSPRIALVYKPVEEGSIYLGWSTSFNPSGEQLSFIANARNFAVSNAFLDPEQNRSIELGSKWELFDGKLSFDAAVYRIEKTNARVPDPANTGFNVLAGQQRVDGVSLNISGVVTSRLSVSGGYTFLDHSELKTLADGSTEWRPMQNVADNTFSMWMDYGFSDRLAIGGGVRYVDERLATNSPPIKSVPDYWAVDAMAKFEWSDHLTFKLNLTNLTNEYYLDQLHPWHVVPGPGFGLVFAVNVTY